MYRITCDGLIILDTRLEEYAVFDPIVNVGTNTVGECTFKVYSSHPHFYDMNLLKSVFEVSDENSVIFRGRMTNNTRDFYNGKAVDLEGAMAFLNDSMVRPFVFPDEFNTESSNNVVEFFLNWLIYNHNSQVEKFQRFRLGNVTVTDPNNYLSRSSENIASTWQILKEKLFDSSLGGYLCIRYEEDGNYIDYLADFEDVNTQEIRFGKNLFDMKHELDASTTYSAIIPIGADIEVESEGETTTKKLTLESIADGKLNNADDTYKVTLNNGLHAIYSESAVENYGWVCCPVEESTWDDVTEVENLLNKGRDYLLGAAGFCSDNIEVTAADLHFTDEEISSFRIYKKVNVISEPHNIEATYNLTRLSIDLVNPQNTKIVVGTIKDTLTDTVSRGGGSGGSGGSSGSGGGGGAIINASSIISALGYTPANEDDIPNVPAWAKNPTKPTYTASEVGARPNTWTPTASDVGADVAGTAETMVSGHNTNADAHNDIRILIKELTTRLNTLADSDDTTLDQMSELVAYIKDNRELIEGVTTNKVNVSDIINNLTTNVSNKPLSAAQGVVLQGLIDALSKAKADKATTLAGYGITDGVTIGDFNNHTSDKVAHITAAERTSWNAKAEVEDIPTKFSQLTDDVGYVKETEFDGHKHVWADITDRAFGEFPAENGIDTVISNDIVYGKYVKVSGAIPTLAEVQKGGTISYYRTDEQWGGNIEGDLITMNYPQGDLTVMNSSNGVVIAYDGIPLVVVAFEDGAEILFNTFEKGTHFNQGLLYFCTHSLTINGYTGFEVIKTLPKKYLPKDIGTVKTVNNTAPDEAGNININIEANKAFTSEYSNTLKWDGNTAGLPNISNADFKVYGEVPTLAEASEGGYFKYEDGGEIKTFTFTADKISAWNDDIYVIYGDDFGEILVASVDNATGYDIVFPEKGVYISSYSGKHICELAFNGYQFSKLMLKGECLPKHEHSWWDIKDTLFGEVKSGNGDTIASDKVVYGNYHKVSDAVPKLADINKGIQLTYHWVKDGKVSKDSRTFDSTDQYCWVSENTAGIVITYDGTPLVVISFTGSSTIGGWTFNGITEAGTYFRQDDYYCTYSLTISEYTGYPYTFTKIAERYLPEDYIKQLIIESLPEDYIKQLIEEVINAGGGTGGEDGLLDSDGNYLYDISNNKLIAKE
jgi:hypothetical protein